MRHQYDVFSIHLTLSTHFFFLSLFKFYFEYRGSAKK